MNTDHTRARLGTSWGRRQWLKFTAFLEDHPVGGMVVMGLVAAFLLFYGVRLHGFRHFGDSFARWRLETFGGDLPVARSTSLPDVMMPFEIEKFDRLDVTSLTAIHFSGTAFAAQIRTIIQGRHGHIRVVALDPRLGGPGQPHRSEFAALAMAYGQEPWEFEARCWHSAAVLLRLRQELGPDFEVRLVEGPSPDARPPYFCIGRSAQAWRSSDPADRLDLITPNPEEADGEDTFTHPGLIVRNRPNHPEVVRFEHAFRVLWDSALPLNDELAKELLYHFDGTRTPGN